MAGEDTEADTHGDVQDGSGAITPRPQLGAEVADEYVEGEERGAWYIRVAKAVGITRSSIVRKLERGHCIPFFCEWCDEPMSRTRSCAYKDCVIRYDHNGNPVEFLADRSPYHNVFVGINRNLLDDLDPVLESAITRVTTAYEQTFWAVPAALEYGQACLAIAKRGFNISTITIYWGPGWGRAQSVQRPHRRDARHGEPLLLRPERVLRRSRAQEADH